MSSSGLSVQLYTVREAAVHDLTETLTRIAGIGYQLIEPYDTTTWGPALADALRSTGLRAPTAHQSFLTATADEQHEIFDTVAALGVERIIDPHYPAEHWQTLEQIADTANRLNAAAAVAAEHSMTVGYHNHAYELQSHPEGPTGRHGLEVLAAQLSPAVGLEVDAYWAAVGGADPVALLKRLAEQVVAVHVKDGPGTKKKKDQVAVGSGSQPIEKIVAATPHALHVVELDDSLGDRFRAIADSFAFLSSVHT